METIGERIKRLRKEADLSQDKLGRLVGATATSIGYWESGTYEPGARYVTNLSKSLGVDPTQLLTGKEKSLAKDDKIYNISNRDFMEVPIMDVVDLETPTGKYAVTKGGKSRRTIAVEVLDESMQPKYPIGALVVSDPANIGEIGKYVLSKPIDGQARIGTLLRYDKNYAIMPEDRSYPMFIIKDIKKEVFGLISGYYVED